MTTGNLTTDLMTAVGTSSGAGTVGFYFNKTWSGTDYPTAKPTYIVEKFPARNGSGTYWTSRRSDKPPKRLRSEDHPYTCNVTTYTDSVFVYRLDTDDPGTEIDEGLFTGTFRNTYGECSASPDWDSNDDLAMISKLHERVQGSTFNAGVFLGEGVKSLKLITNTALTLSRALSSLRRGEWDRLDQILRPPRKRPAIRVNLQKGTERREAPRGVDSMSTRWLEAQYGWMPLLQDMEGAAQSLAKILNFPMVQRYRVRKKRFFNVLSPSPSSAYFPDSHGVTRVQLIARVSEVSVPTLVGLTNPLSVAWELVPYSFISDWVYPIGEFLAARSLAQALTGTYVRTRVDRWSTGKPQITNPLVVGAMPAYQRKMVTMTRTVSNSLTVPTPSFKPLEKVASVKHCISALALLQQAAKPRTSFGQNRNLNLFKY